MLRGTSQELRAKTLPYTWAHQEAHFTDERTAVRIAHVLDTAKLGGGGHLLSGVFPPCRPEPGRAPVRADAPGAGMRRLPH